MQYPITTMRVAGRYLSAEFESYYVQWAAKSDQRFACKTAVSYQNYIDDAD